MRSVRYDDNLWYGELVLMEKYKWIMESIELQSKVFAHVYFLTDKYSHNIQFCQSNKSVISQKSRKMQQNQSHQTYISKSLV
jgi:hypothetical protein